METTPNQNPAPSSISPAQKKSNRTLLIAIIAIVVVVVLVVAIALVVLPSSSPHFGFVSLSTVEHNTNATLTESSVISVTSSSNTSLLNGLVKGEEIYFNGTSGEITIVIAQFSSSSQATNFYNSEMSHMTAFHVSLTNSSYDSFYYSYISTTLSSYSEAMALGHSGSIVFLIVDLNIFTSNFNALIQDQISAMA